MNDELPFLERVLRVSHSHVAHRALPPTRFEPWTNRDKQSFAYRQYVGMEATNQLTEERTYCYVVPDFSAQTPTINVHLGKAGDPDQDEIVCRIPITWDGPIPPMGGP